jgi:TRAP-type transport system periplasmic protein
VNFTSIRRELVSSGIDYASWEEKTMRIRNCIKTAAACLVATFLASPSHAENFRLLHSWDSATEPNTAYVLSNFVPRIGEAIDGATLSAFGPETIPPFEQLQPAQAGVFQFLFTHTAYHFGTTRVAFGVDAIKGNSTQRREAGVWDEVDRQYNTVGMKLLAMIVTPGGFHMQVRDPLKDGRLDGKVIRATNVYRSVVEALGAKNVVMPIGEVYTALDRGVVDGAASPLIGSVSLGWNEVAKYVVRPRFGYSTYYLMMNLTAYEALPDPQKAKLLALGREIEVGGEELVLKLANEEEEKLQSVGSTVTEMAPEVSDKLEAIWADGLFSMSAETNEPAATAIRDIARKAGLVN